MLPVPSCPVLLSLKALIAVFHGCPNPRFTADPSPLPPARIAPLARIAPFAACGRLSKVNQDRKKLIAEEEAEELKKKSKFKQAAHER